MQTSIPTIETFQGDSAPNVTFTVTREDGTIVDLTGMTVLFRILDPRTQLRTNDAGNVCNITSPTNGLCVYTWNPTDIPDVGLYHANLQINHGSGSYETAQVSIRSRQIV